MPDLEDSRWAETNSPAASSRTDDIWFADAETGWLVNSNGQVCKTEDGGASWKQQLFVSPNSLGQPYLRCIHFAPDAQTGWFGALTNASSGKPGDYLKALLHHTRDGGKSWEPVTNLPPDSPEGICGLSVVDECVVYGSGSNDPAKIGPAVIKTEDGGKTWSAIDMSGHASNLIDIRFFDANCGWVVGGRKDDSCPTNRPEYGGAPQYAPIRPVVLYTEDGGKSWENRVAGMDFECGGWGWKLFWLDRQMGFVSIENFLSGAILKTVDGGRTWTRLPINDKRIVNGKEVSNANLEGIGFLNPQKGWVGGWGDRNFIGDYNSLTLDGGQNWTAQDHSDSDPSSDVRVNVNRYRFLGDPVAVGYCSGKKVYKLAAALEPVHLEAPAVAAQGEILGLSSSGSTAPGSVEIRLEVPEGAESLYVGLWNHFGWHIRTLADEASPAAGERRLVWNGRDEAGASLAGTTVICRVMAGEACESINISVPQPS